MRPSGIVTRRITTYAGQLAEIPPDAPRGLRTWTCHAVFVPGGKAGALKPRIKQVHSDITKVEGGAFVYGGHFWLSGR
jgi:hypothetical protein